MTSDAGDDTTADADPADTGADASVDGGGDAAGDAGQDTSADTGVDTTTDAGDFVCGEGVVYTGQVFRPDDAPADSPNGGIPTFTPYAPTYDAGLAAVIAAGVNQEDPVAVELEVVEATVVASSYNNDTALRAQTNFYIADANGTIEVRLDQDDTESHPQFPIIVGQKVSFTATSLGWYGDFPQVAAGSGFTLISEDNPVYILEPEADAPLSFDDAPGVVRVTGTVISGEGPCGGSSNCFTLDYGATETITLRTASTFLEVGDCATFVGPMTSFSRVPQLNTVNFDWLRDYTFNE